MKTLRCYEHDLEAIAEIHAHSRDGGCSPPTAMW